MYILPYLITAAVFLPGIRFISSNDEEGNFKNSMKRMNSLRALFAVLIVFAHCAATFEATPKLLLPLWKISTFEVGFFFMMSGYGLAFSVGTKKDYLKNFYKKILRLLWIVVFASIVNRIIKAAALGEAFGFHIINWYMPALIGCYVVFYISYKFFGKTRKSRAVTLSILMFAATVVALIISAAGKCSRSYYISELAFPFGAVMYEYSDKFEKFLKKKYAFIAVLIGEIVLFASTWFAGDETFLDLLTHNAAMVPFGLLILFVCMHISIDNVMTRFLNKRSLQIYLFQFVAMDIIKRYIYPDNALNVLFFVYSLLLTLVIAVVVGFIQEGLEAGAAKYISPLISRIKKTE